MNSRDNRYIGIVPSKRQLEFQKLEFYAFFHFTMNTFTDKEWGYGNENPTIFDPKKMDALQWVRAIKAAGMTGAILTCKHHDGFCLWPSKYTKHTIASSPYKDGKGDIVKEVSMACKQANIKFGIYLSPWDRNNETYGYGDSYNNYFVNQLKELLTGYGDIFTVWFDGACGEGSNGKKQIYDWERYYEVIRKYQPDACISVCGPDIRWCGNEAGDTRVSEWSVVPKRLSKAEIIQANSQQSDSEEFRQKTIASSDIDLGSRKALEGEEEFIWYPAEVNTSIRPGWFYHELEDDKVRSLEELMNIYYGSVGGNGTFLLNIPPTKEGLIHKNDEKRLAEMGSFIRQTFSHNLLQEATLRVDTDDGVHKIEGVKEDSYEQFYQTEEGRTKATITVTFQKKQKISYVVLKENIKLSQRIEELEIEAKFDDEYCSIYKGTVVGYKKIIKTDAIKTDEIRIKILDARVSVTLAFLGVY